MALPAKLLGPLADRQPLALMLKNSRLAVPAYRFGKRAFGRPSAADAIQDQARRQANQFAPLRSSHGLARMLDQDVVASAVGGIARVRKNGLAERVFFGPSAPKAIAQSARRAAESHCPLGKAQSLAVERELAVSRGVVGLCGRVCPPDIARFVIAVIVDAIERSAIWAWTHVGEETGEVHPPLADRNSAASVKTISRIRLSKTSAPHTFPCAVLTTYTIAYGVAVLVSPCVFLTAAGLAIARNKIARLRQTLVAAVAAATPQHFPGRMPFCRLDDCQHTKPKACQATGIGMKLCHVQLSVNQLNGSLQ